jgi:hypothetical protein
MSAYPVVPVTSVTVVQPSSHLNTPLVAAAVLAGGWAALTAAFLRNYPLTTYAESKRWLLALLWPLLLFVSPKFRAQWQAAVRGERPPSERSGPGSGGSGGSDEAQR